MKVIILTGRAERRQFRYPAGRMPHTVVVHDRLTTKRPGQVVRPCGPGLAEKIAALRPSAVAAPYRVFLDLWQRLGSDFHLSHAAVVLTPHCGPRLTREQRDMLWACFEVPVFEQVLSASGALLAWECEAHDGLHVVREWPGMDKASLVRTRCECGLESPRLPESLKALAARAG